MLEVNPAYIDDGMRYAVYKWALAEEARIAPADFGALDRIMREAATLLSFCIIGAAETEIPLGRTDPGRTGGRRSMRCIANGEDQTFDARLIKLVLAKDVAAPDIRAQVTLDQDPD